MFAKKKIAFVDIRDEARKEREGLDARYNDVNRFDVSMAKDKDIIRKKEVCELALFSSPLKFEIREHSTRRDLS